MRLAGFPKNLKYQYHDMLTQPGRVAQKAELADAYMLKW